MTISLDELYQHCEKQVVLLPGDAPLGEALWEFQDRHYEESTAWLVVELDDGSYRVSRFADLAPLLLAEGYAILNTPLRELSLPAVERVVTKETNESLQTLLDWLSVHPAATVIVVDGERCAGLLTAGVISKGIDISKPTLAGVLEQISPRASLMQDEEIVETRSIEPAAEVQAVELHTDIDFPSHIQLGQPQPLKITLTPQAPADTRVDERVTVEFAEPFTPEPVEVSIHAPGFTERTNTWTRTIDVYSFTESSPAVFVLTAANEGAYLIGIDFRHKDRLIGSTTIDVLVSEQPPAAELLSRVARGEPVTPAPAGEDATADADISPAPALVISQSPPSPADVELRVHLSRDNVLSYELHSYLVDVGYHHEPMGEIELSEDPRHFLTGLFAELSELARDRAADNADQVIRQLEGIGENLFLDLFPEPLRQAYWTLVDLREQKKIRSLLITSDEPWIPWELIKPYDADKDRTDDFWAGSWQICRWLAGPGPADRVRILAARLIAPILDLDFVEKEKTYFESMQGRGVNIGPAPLQRLEEVQALTEQGGVELIHFATHGNFSDANPDESVIRLAEQAELYPRDLRGSRVRGLRKARPMVFLNACHTAQIGFALTGLGGWAERIIGDVRASAFIGTLWEVNDELAAEFSGTFYQTLWQGAPLGQAFHAARAHVRELSPANSTWLAYTLYGDPNVQVFWGN
jgi:hypothetical protein